MSAGRRIRGTSGDLGAGCGRARAAGPPFAVLPRPGPLGGGGGLCDWVRPVGQVTCHCRARARNAGGRPTPEACHPVSPTPRATRRTRARLLPFVAVAASIPASTAWPSFVAMPQVESPTSLPLPAPPVPAASTAPVLADILPSPSPEVTLTSSFTPVWDGGPLLRKARSNGGQVASLLWCLGVRGGGEGLGRVEGAAGAQTPRAAGQDRGLPRAEPGWSGGAGGQRRASAVPRPSGLWPACLVVTSSGPRPPAAGQV